MLADIANNYGASPAVSALTDSTAEIIGAWYAATVGGSNPYLSMSTNQMLAAIRNDIVGGTAKSHLFASSSELLADIASSITGTTVSRFTSSVGAMLALVTGGGYDAVPPGDLSAVTVGATVNLGNISLAFTAPVSENVRRVKVYRNTTGTLVRASDLALSIPVSSGEAKTDVLGDPATVNLFTNSAFTGAATGWSLGTNWTYGTNDAHHATSAAGYLSQAFVGSTSQKIRASFDVANYSGAGANLYMMAYSGAFGSTPRGNTTVLTPAGGSGQKLGSFTLSGACANLGIVGNSTAVVDIDNVYAYVETPTSLSQGTHYVWLIAENGSGVEGTVSGPHAVTVI